MANIIFFYEGEPILRCLDSYVVPEPGSLIIAQEGETPSVVVNVEGPLLMVLDVAKWKLSKFKKTPDSTLFSELCYHIDILSAEPHRCEVCNHPKETVYWNQHNERWQCHNCGAVPEFKVFNSTYIYPSERYPFSRGTGNE